VTLHIKSNRKWRAFIHGADVPDKIMRAEFDYLDDDMKCDGFIQYRKWWYHVSQFEVCHKNSPLWDAGWTGFLSDSFYSGLVIRLDQDYQDQYQIGVFTS